MRRSCQFVSLLLTVLGFSPIRAASEEFRNPGSTSGVIRVSISGIVHPITVEIIGDAIAQAREQQASAILISLNTPGGLLNATREMIEKIVASSVPIITYVEPSGGRAASAGFFLLQAGDVAAMAPGT